MLIYGVIFKLSIGVGLMLLVKEIYESKGYSTGSSVKSLSFFGDSYLIFYYI